MRERHGNNFLKEQENENHSSERHSNRQLMEYLFNYQGSGGIEDEALGKPYDQFSRDIVECHIRWAESAACSPEASRSNEQGDRNRLYVGGHRGGDAEASG